ncbi:MAG: hypothetical protein H6Q30_1855 [Bacteroidetes bacterium]|jgi:ketosteroid isomerase-like protein|nr:hypothetical protein [Bacteroidota bacterium]
MIFSANVLLCAITAAAHDDTTTEDVTSLVSAERAFARTSAEKGMDSAFMAFLSDDAIIFRPHPVNGQEWFRTHPVPSIALSWSPGFADVSSSGDLGYTTGPWMARDRTDSTAPPSYGDFVSVWRKRGREWKVDLDLGVSHPAPPEEVQFSSPRSRSGQHSLVRPDTSSMMAAWSRLLAQEREVFGDSLAPVPVRNLVSSLSPDARVFRPGHLPILGSDSAKKLLDSRSGTFFRRQLGGGISRDGDLGYTYGVYHSYGENRADEKGGYYLTLWKRGGTGDWDIVLDLENRHSKQ